MQEIDIQTISDETLELIFKEQYLNDLNIPSEDSIIKEENQTNYFKETKKQVIQRLETNKFAIIS
jgi:hypothetical protein